MHTFEIDGEKVESSPDWKRLYFNLLKKVEKLEREIEEYKLKASWKVNPDTSGGAFTQEEIHRNKW